MRLANKFVLIKDGKEHIGLEQVGRFLVYILRLVSQIVSLICKGREIANLI